MADAYAIREQFVARWARTASLLRDPDLRDGGSGPVFHGPLLGKNAGLRPPRCEMTSPNLTSP